MRRGRLQEASRTGGHSHYGAALVATADSTRHALKWPARQSDYGPTDPSLPNADADAAKREQRTCVPGLRNP